MCLVAFSRSDRPAFSRLLESSSRVVCDPNLINSVPRMIFETIWIQYRSGLRAICSKRGRDRAGNAFLEGLKRTGYRMAGSWSSEAIEGLRGVVFFGRFIIYCASLAEQGNDGRRGQKGPIGVEGSGNVHWMNAIWIGGKKRREDEGMEKSRNKSGGSEEISGDANFLGSGSPDPTKHIKFPRISFTGINSKSLFSKESIFNPISTHLAKQGPSN